jgi:hypothetical protein
LHEEQFSTNGRVRLIHFLESGLSGRGHR